MDEGDVRFGGHSDIGSALNGAARGNAGDVGSVAVGRGVSARVVGELGRGALRAIRESGRHGPGGRGLVPKGDDA